MYQVCPNCKVELTGDKCPCCKQTVTPIKSAVRNEFFSEWIPACEYCGRPVSSHFVGCSRPRRAEQRVDWAAA